MAYEPKLGFMASLGYTGWEVEDVLKSLSRLSYDAVEWPFSFFNPRAKSAKERRALVQKTRDHGLEVSEVVVQQDLVVLDDAARKDVVQLVLETIEAAAEAGVGTLNLFTGPAPWSKDSPRIPDDISEGAAWNMVFEAFDLFVAQAELKQMHLAVEGVWGMLCHDFYTTRLLIDRIDSQWLGVNFDPSHDVLVGNFDSGWIAKQWGPKIKHVHLKDAVGVSGEGTFLFPLLGEGRVDWQGFFGALADMEYDGYMSVEFESFGYYQKVLGGDPEEAAKISMDAIRRLMKL